MDRTDSALWSRIADRDDAVYIVRAAGMAAIFMGLIGGVLIILNPFYTRDISFVVALFLTAVLFLAGGLRIMRLQMSLIPVFSILSLMNLVAAHGFPIRVDRTLPLVLNVIMLNGLRGWWWLRRHPETGTAAIHAPDSAA